jgi:hypothetical protein
MVSGEFSNEANMQDLGQQEMMKKIENKKRRTRGRVHYYERGGR